jgi:hypothetical protein
MSILPTKLTCEVPDQSLETVVNILSHTETFLVLFLCGYLLSLLYSTRQFMHTFDPCRRN